MRFMFFLHVIRRGGAQYAMGSEGSRVCMKLLRTVEAISRGH